MSLIVICGGGGKSTLVKNYPGMFLDIDDFIWSSHNRKHHEQLTRLVQDKDHDGISKLYQHILESNKDFFQEKIALGHHPIYSEWMDVKLLIQLKPSKRLHEINIQDREPHLQDIARRNWRELPNAIEYDSWKKFHQLIFQNL